jgi:signal transduction histidine kinase
LSKTADNVFAISESNLSAVSCDRVLGDLEVFLQRRTEDNIVLDLSGLGFVDPYGMGMLCLIGQALSQRYWDISCLLPEDPAIESYLTRMRVFEILSGHATLERTPETERPPARNERLMEVVGIGERRDIEDVLGAIEKRVSVILSEELGYAVREITDFKNVVAELCHNILDHSGGSGFLSVQRYLNTKIGQKFAIIGVGDLGIGIRKSLAERFDVSDWTHAQAIVNAVRKEFSRDTARGLGLYIVNQICQTYRGSLHIRSGDARVYFRGKRSAVHGSAGFPGTQASITLYEKG